MVLGVVMVGVNVCFESVGDVAGVCFEDSNGGWACKRSGGGAILGVCDSRDIDGAQEYLGECVGATLGVAFGDGNGGWS